MKCKYYSNIVCDFNSLDEVRDDCRSFECDLYEEEVLRRKALGEIVFFAIDCQKDFMNSDGLLSVPGAEAIKPKLKEITDYARERSIKVVNTADCHTDKTTEISDKPNYKTTFPPHCMLLGGDGIEFIEETDPRKDFSSNYTMVCYSDDGFHESFDRARNIIVYKDEFDVFEGNLHTDKLVRRLNPDKILVYGVATNVCVDKAVMGLLERGRKVYVAIDAIKELPGLPVDEIFESWVENGAQLAKWDVIKEII